MPSWAFLQTCRRHRASLGSDSEILEVARVAGEIILTHDLDYGTLLAFSGTPNPPVIIFRVSDVKTEHLVERVEHAWPHIAEALERGAVIVIEDDTIRIRHLPISK